MADIVASESRNAILLGPTKAGKTQLLCAARHSAGNHRFISPKGCEHIDLLTFSDDEEGLQSFYDHCVKHRTSGGLMPGSEGVKKVKFGIMIGDENFSYQGVANFVLFDPQGTKVAPNPNESPITSAGDFHKALRLGDGADDGHAGEILEATDSIIYCIPVGENLKDTDLRGVLGLIANAKTLRSITVCITKFDSVFLGSDVIETREDGTPTTQFAQALDPAYVGRTIQQRMSERDVAALAAKLDSLQNVAPGAAAPAIKVMPVSAFGFVPGTGQANIRSFNGRFEMLTAVAAAEEPQSPDYPYDFEEVFGAEDPLSLWRPFQAFEAFLSVLVSNRDMTDVGILSFDWPDIRPGH